MSKVVLFCIHVPEMIVHAIELTGWFAACGMVIPYKCGLTAERTEPPTEL